MLNVAGIKKIPLHPKYSDSAYTPISSRRDFW